MFGSSCFACNRDRKLDQPSYRLRQDMRLANAGTPILATAEFVP